MVAAAGRGYNAGVMRAEDRERVTVEVACRVLGEKLLLAEKGGPSVDAWIHDTIFEERRRLDRERGSRKAEESAFYDDARRRALHASEEERKAILRRIIERFVAEIAGNFDPRVYAAATSVVPTGLALLLNALSPRRLLGQFPALPSLSTNVLIRGETETLRRLDQLGTVILCPTHSSNLDSIVVGWALHRLGLPPYIYGAGLNLFSNPVISFFMHNLGAFKVDRKKTALLYKDVLKEYCTVTLENGYDNLFFPGGTRSRSGAVESRLKLGLLGCGLRAYQGNLRRKARSPKIFIVPCTLSYQLVLEAETLIDDYLKETGKARYIIEDDESAQWRKILDFMSQVVNLDARIFLTISPALDPFGNRVEADGESYDRRGRRVDVARYVTRGDEVVGDAQRDAEYTRELGERVIEEFRADNTLQATNIVAFTLFDLLRRKNPGMDLYRLLRTGGLEDSVPFAEAAGAVGRVVARVKDLGEQGKGRLDPRLYGLAPDAVLADALRAFGTYHARPAVQRRGDRILSGDMNLLFFYSNRAVGYGLEKAIDEERPAPPPIDPARRILDGGLVVPKAPTPGLPVAAPGASKPRALAEAEA
jgi:glycerol-3-phosphate O-acyltransferase